MRSATVLAALGAAATLAAQASVPDRPATAAARLPDARPKRSRCRRRCSTASGESGHVAHARRLQGLRRRHRQPIDQLHERAAVDRCRGPARHQRQHDARRSSRRAWPPSSSSSVSALATAPPSARSTTRSSSADFTGNRDFLLRTLRENHRFANPTRMFDAVDEAMTLLEPLGGRRVVVVLTDGCDTGSQTGLGYASPPVHVRRADALHRAVPPAPPTEPAAARG